MFRLSLALVCFPLAAGNFLTAVADCGGAAGVTGFLAAGGWALPGPDAVAAMVDSELFHRCLTDAGLARRLSGGRTVWQCVKGQCKPVSITGDCFSECDDHDATAGAGGLGVVAGAAAGGAGGVSVGTVAGGGIVTGIVGQIGAALGTEGAAHANVYNISATPCGACLHRSSTQRLFVESDKLVAPPPAASSSIVVAMAMMAVSVFAIMSAWVRSRGHMRYSVVSVADLTSE